MDIQHFSQERALHPALLEMVEACPGNQLLDYGCGDGRILERLSSRWTIDAYDPSAQMRRISLQRIGHRLRHLAPRPSELGDSYDVVLLGMVILCLPDKGMVLRVLKDCAVRLGVGGRLFITTTHPCFRSFEFSNFSTSFGKKQPFSYLNEGEAFEVKLGDPVGDPVVFTDFHWSLGFTFEALSSVNLSVVALVEVPDDPDSQDRNPLVPPFLILECRKNS